MNQILKNRQWNVIRIYLSCSMCVFNICCILVEHQTTKLLRYSYTCIYTQIRLWQGDTPKKKQGHSLEPRS